MAKGQVTMTGKRILIIIGVLALACVVCVAVAFVATGGAILAVFNAAQPIVTTSNDFMTALKDGNYNTAYGLLTPSVQSEIGGNADALRQTIESNNVRPVSWNFTSFNVSGGTGEVSGSVTFTGNRPGTGSLVLAQEGNQWKVAGFNLKEQ
jgi:hypothetical protein